MWNFQHLLQGPVVDFDFHIQSVSCLRFCDRICLSEQLQSGERTLCLVHLLVGVRRVSVVSLLIEFYLLTSHRWIGLIFAENEEMYTMFELSVYYVQHFFTSFLGPVILSLSGRFDPLTYASFPLPVCGFHLFCLYMRLFLTPLAHISWANLNHTLCGVDNDPFFATF